MNVWYRRLSIPRNVPMTMIYQILLCIGALSPLAHLAAMEVLIPSMSTSESAQISASRSRVPSLKKLILTQLVRKVVAENDSTLLDFLKKHYHDDAAHILADDNRILLWNIFRDIQKPLHLDHSIPPENSMPSPITSTSIAAAAFSPDNKFLVTIATNGENDTRWIATVWSLAEIDQHYRSLNMPRCDGASRKEERSSLPPLKPYKRITFGRDLPSYGCSATFNPQGTRLYVSDTVNLHCLAFDLEGALKPLWRISANREHRDKEYQGIEAAQKVRCFGPISINALGQKALIHISDTPNPCIKDSDLFCIDLSNEALLIPFPSRNHLDETQIIAHGITSASWYPDGQTILVVEPGAQSDNDEASGTDSSDFKGPTGGFMGETSVPSSFRKINTEGTVLEEFDTFPLCTDPAWIEVTPSSRFCLIKSANCDRFSSNIHDRVDLYDIKAGTIKAILDHHSTKERPIKDALIMPDERYILIILEGGRSRINSSCWITIWDTATNMSTAAVIIENAHYYEKLLNPMMKVSSDGSYLFLASVNDEKSILKPQILALKTPFAGALNLEELLLLMRMEFQGKAILTNPTAKALYEGLGGSSPYAPVILKAAHAYFENK